MLSQQDEPDVENQTDLEETDTRSMYTAIAIAAVVLISGTSVVVLAIGGTVNMVVSLDGNNMIMVNESEGVFNRYEWKVENETGEVAFETEVSNKDPVIWEYGKATAFTIYLTAYSYLGGGHTIESKMGSYEVAWNHYKVDVGVNMADYKEYSNHIFKARTLLPRWPGDALNSVLLSEFTSTETKSGSFERIVDQLKEQADETWTKEATINYLMEFVQNLDGDDTYKADISPYSGTSGSYDHWNFPIETLYNKGGDCEDLAILLLALVGSYFDEDVHMGMMVYWGSEEKHIGGHAIAAISMESPPHPTSDKGNMQTTIPTDEDGRKYYACETVSRGWQIGRIQSTYQPLELDMFVTIVG